MTSHHFGLEPDTLWKGNRSLAGMEEMDHDISVDVDVEEMEIISSRPFDKHESNRIEWYAKPTFARWTLRPEIIF